MSRRKATGDGRVFRGMYLTVLRIPKVVSDMVIKPCIDVQSGLSSEKGAGGRPALFLIAFLC